MKYYEFIEPYYALIKATDRNEAIEIYEKDVADLEGERFTCSEVNPSFALLKISREITENTSDKLNVDKILHDFSQIDSPELLVIDSSLA